MKPFDFLLVAISTSLLAVSQTFLKLWVDNRNVVAWPLNTALFKAIFTWELIGFGVSLFVSGMIWIGLLKKSEMSMLYPMISLSYVFGLILAMVVFREHVTVFRWAGVMLIMVGVYCLSR